MKTSRLWVYATVSRMLPETRFFGLKTRLLRWCGARVGTNVRICSSARFYGGGELAIGDDVWIGGGGTIHPVAGASVKIGCCCDVGPEVLLLTGSQEIDPAGTHIAGRGTAADVDVGNGSWLGARSVLLPGVKLAEKTLVAAGSVVSRSVLEPSCLVAGVPAVVKKSY